MKKLLLSIIIATLLLLVSCASNATAYIKSSNQEILLDRAEGEMPAQAWQNFRDKEAKINTNVLIEEKIREAIRNGDYKTAKDLKDLKSTLELFELTITNSCSFVVTIISGEFNGTTLRSGESVTRKIKKESDSYSFDVMFNRRERTTINRNISDTSVITIIEIPRP